MITPELQKLVDRGIARLEPGYAGLNALLYNRSQDSPGL
jgi:hypothetical protein